MRTIGNNCVYPIPGRKSNIIDLVMSSPKEKIRDGTILEGIVEWWNMKPHPKTNSIKMGSVNKISVLKYASLVFENHYMTEIDYGPYAFGLVFRKWKR